METPCDIQGWRIKASFSADIDQPVAPKSVYADLPLSEAVKRLAALHYQPLAQHLSSDEHDLLIRAAEVIGAHDPYLMASI
jgi:hypothetical protein